MILNTSKLYVKFLGISLIGIFIYFRYIIEKLPRSLNVITLNADGVYINMYLLIFAVSLFMLSFTVAFMNYKIVTKGFYNPPINFFTKVTIKIIYVIKDSLFAVYNSVYNSLENGYETLKRFCQYSYAKTAYKEKYIVMFDSALLLIVCSSFAYEVIFKFTLYYFYYSLMLLGISLLIKLWLHMIADYVHCVNDLAQKSLIITHKYLPDGQDEFTFTLKPGFTEEQKMAILEYDMQEYLAMVSSEGFLKSYKFYEDYYRPKTLLIVYIIYTIGWFYILTKNFILITPFLLT